MDNNLIKELLDEISRCKELVSIYESIGPAGAFGRLMIKAELESAEKAIAENDVAHMITALKSLKGCK